MQDEAGHTDPLQVLARQGALAPTMQAAMQRGGGEGERGACRMGGGKVIEGYSGLIRTERAHMGWVRLDGVKPAWVHLDGFQTVSMRFQTRHIRILQTKWVRLN